MLETGTEIDLVEWVIEREVLPFPNVDHLDWLDAAARIMDPTVHVPWPEPEPERVTDAWRDAWYGDDEDEGPPSTWEAM